MVATHSQSWQMTLHFICTQCQGILMFYVGLRSYLALTSNWTATHLFITNEGDAAWRSAKTLGGTLDCVLNESYTMIMAFWPGYVPKCVGTMGTAWMYGMKGMPFNVLASAVNLTGFSLVTLFCTVLWMNLRKTGAENIGQGKYLAYTYTVQKSRAFTVLSWVLIIFNIAIVLDTIRFLVTLCMTGYDLFVLNYVEYLLPTLLALAYSAYSLGSSVVDPFFDYDSQEFHDLQFSRGWSDVLTDNNQFALNLGLALLAEKRGNKKELRAMLDVDFEPKVSKLEDVVKVCDMRSEKEPLNSGA